MTKSEVCDLSERIGGLSTRGEKEALYDLAMKYIPEGGLALEVGTWTGGSSVIIGNVCKEKNARLICIDAFSSDMHSVGDTVRSDAFNTVLTNCYQLPIDYMAGDSVNFLKYLADEIIDFAFIDGDHHYPKVEQDIEGYYNKLNFGGCYFMHDYLNPCDVKQVVDNFFDQDQLNFVDSSVWVEKKNPRIKFNFDASVSQIPIDSQGNLVWLNQLEEKLQRLQPLVERLEKLQ